MARILVVEDSPSQAYDIVTLLEDSGMEAVTAGGAEEALARLAETPFDLVLSDIHMPGPSGYDLCRSIRKESRWGGLPIILLTTLQRPADILRGLECQADNYITKPFEPSFLVQRIKSTLHQREKRVHRSLSVDLNLVLGGERFSLSPDLEKTLDYLLTTVDECMRMKQAEHDRRLHAETDRFFMLSMDMLCIADRDGFFQRLNPAWERLCPVSELLSHPWLEFVHPEDRPKAEDAVARLRDGAAEVRFETRWATRDGKWRILQWGATMAREEHLLYGTARDITERAEAEERERQLEAQLWHAQKLEAVGRLAGGISHDFNNLLTVITGYCALLVAEAGAHDRPMLEEIGKAADKATSLTRQLLTFSRRQVSQPKTLDLNAVVTDLEKLLARLLGPDIELVARINPTPVRLKADPTHLEQIVVNLAVNARDAMPQGGRLEIRAERMGDEVALVVTDTGTGMDQATLTHMFEPFFTTKPEGKGTGLGLSTVYGIVEQAGGHIEVDSTVGEGTRFRIVLPASDDPPDAVVEAREETRERGAETILLVEDDEEVRRLATTVLQRNGYQVLGAAQGQEALALARHHAGPIHLLMADLVMPGMNGRELAQALRQDRPKLGVLLTSGYTEQVALYREVTEAGVPFLQKPYSPTALLQKLRELLGKRR
ncbi:MAG TPA: response regulator [Candidatus Xenobia bacterium]